LSQKKTSPCRKVQEDAGPGRDIFLKETCGEMQTQGVRVPFFFDVV